MVHPLSDFLDFVGTLGGALYPKLHLSFLLLPGHVALTAPHLREPWTAGRWCRGRLYAAWRGCGVCSPESPAARVGQRPYCDARERAHPARQTAGAPPHFLACFRTCECRELAWVTFSGWCRQKPPESPGLPSRGPSFCGPVPRDLRSGRPCPQSQPDQLSPAASTSRRPCPSGEGRRCRQG